MNDDELVERLANALEQTPGNKPSCRIIARTRLLLTVNLAVAEARMDEHPQSCHRCQVETDATVAFFSDSTP
ncbi:hypothetical protein, partial [Candidatus Methylomirabilis sp.]|uniref:hypothetical protein n=1 Tax=Candidatus Methylomirabilis sp. TaxID=2032687 RepID=UPI003C748ACA